MVLDKTFHLLKKRYARQLENLIITEVRIGLHLTAVALSDNSHGVASTLTATQPREHEKKRNFDAFSPSQIKGRKVLELFDPPRQTNITDTLKLAVMNAVSSKILPDTPYKVLEDADPIDLLDLNGSKNITMVGAFQSYIKKIAATQNHLKVLELDKKTFHPEHQKYYVPAEAYQSILPASDIVIITGLTLLNNTIDALLSTTSSGARVIVTGPSSSLIPDVLFENNVDIIGATKITNPEMLFTIVGEGGSGYHLFGYCAKKICILKE